jgi:hypothetical protein
MKNTNDDHEDNWIRDLIIQYVTSPIWKEHVENFKDEFCITFDSSTKATL